MYINKSIREYLKLVESGDPFPGGGSVASLVSSLAGTLTLMTSNLSIEKEYFKKLDPDIQEKVKRAHMDIKKSINRFNKYMDEDAEGFKTVIETYEEEADSKEEKQKKLEDSYKKALQAPLKCSRECLKLLRLQDIIVEYGNNQTITDVGVGVFLVYAALEGCIISVRINLNYIKDTEYVKEIQGEINEIHEEARNIKNSLNNKIDKILEE